MKKHFGGGFAAVLFYVFLSALFFCFQKGGTAPFQFDDYGNLNWLANADDSRETLLSLFSGKSGPLGRPLSLAGFLVDGYFWPFDSIPFHRTNTLLHLLNGCLLAVVLLQLRGIIKPQPPLGLVLLSVCLWMSLPLLASTSLLVVQRMTLLSATFTLAGIGLYLCGRGFLPDKPRLGLSLMTTAVAVFTPLATLSKENGALLPFYLIVLEYCLLPALPAKLGKRQRIFLRLLTCLPALAVCAYLLFMLCDITTLYAGYSGRPFTLSERLQTQIVILWIYLRWAFSPDMAALGPYHDNYPIYTIATHPLLVVSSCVAWLLVLGAAFRLYQKLPLLLFAISWYLVGHLLESSFLPLELYFEHRNYLPLIGPVYAFSVILGSALNNVVLRYSILGTYLAVQFLILMQTTQLWGDAVESAYYWSRNQPDSIRAAQFLAQQLALRQRNAEAVQAIERALARHPLDAALRLQQMQLLCDMRVLTLEMAVQTERELMRSKFSAAAISTLNVLTGIDAAEHCSVLDTFRLHSILDVLARNEKFFPVAYHLHHLKANLYEREKQLAPAIAELNAALKINPTLDTFIRIADILSTAGYYREARMALADAQGQVPNDPLARRYWLERLNAYSRALDPYGQ